MAVCECLSVVAHTFSSPGHSPSSSSNNDKNRTLACIAICPFHAVKSNGYITADPGPQFGGLDSGPGGTCGLGWHIHCGVEVTESKYQ